MCDAIERTVGIHHSHPAEPPEWTQMIRLPSDAPSGVVLAHTDALRTRNLIEGKLDRAGFLNAQLEVIAELTDGRPTWFPTFNYDFLGTKRYSVSGDVCQVGSINEFVRVERADWRTTTPVFNFAGTGVRPADARINGAVCPFDELSVFGQCFESDGIVLWYGAPFSSATILHYAESRAGGPLYRFDKDFAGTVLDDGRESEVTLRYHVRPLDRHLEYDWARIMPVLLASGVVRQLGDGPPVFWSSARALIETWVEELERDPLFLLDEASREWVAPELAGLGRRFELSDFEELA